MDPQPGSDTAARLAHLVERACDGDREALAVLFEHYQPMLLGYLRRRASQLVRGRESSMDLLQSVCREVLERLDHFEDYGRGEAAFKNWLFKQGERKLIDKHRFWDRDMRAPSREQPAPGPSEEQPLAGDTPTPSQVLLGEEQKAELRGALRHLQEAQRQVLELVYLEGLSNAEIATRLDRTEGAVRALQSRALVALAKHLPPSETR